MNTDETPDVIVTWRLNIAEAARLQHSPEDRSRQVINAPEQVENE